MDHFVKIYTQRAAAYHRMIVPEDVDGNLVPTLERIAPFAGKRVLDLGTGTGRLPLLVGHRTKQIVGLDLHEDMLREHLTQKEQRSGLWGVVQGDMRRLPFPTNWADVVTAGWAIGHFTGWYGDKWPPQIGTVLEEMHRVVAPAGALIIIETLTTGGLEPAPPTRALADYYRLLENDWGFTRQQIRTDFQFGSVDEAVARTEFFFGSELARTVRDKAWARLPEWTGVWGKTG
jgi:SAM-dependent methyltransferase